MDPYMLATYNYKFNQYLHSGCTADIAAAEALRSVRSFYGQKANNQEFLNYANRISSNVSNSSQINTPTPGMAYQYNPQYGMVPSNISNISYGSTLNIDTTAMYNQQILNQSNQNLNSALLSGISIKPPNLPQPPPMPIHPSQYRQSNLTQNSILLPTDINIENSPGITEWIYKIYSVHVTDKSTKKWKMAVSNYINKKIMHWRANNINPSKIDLMIPSADVIEMHSVPDVSTDPVNKPLESKIIPEIKSEKKVTKIDKKADKHKDSFEIDIIGVKNKSEYKNVLKKRAERFKDPKPAVETPVSSVDRLIGTSTDMEKQYLRLTGEPNPAYVRPIEILKKSFIHVLEKYKSTLNYRYIQEQFRSIRQDMKVQHINDLFATHVYETNARIALLNSDLDQFNQCQTQLIDLHSLNQVPAENNIEFKCYRLLYLSLQNTKMDLLRYLKELNSIEDDAINKYASIIDYANRMRRIIQDENYYRYFSMVESSRTFEEDLDSVFNIAIHNRRIEIPRTSYDPPFFSRYLFKMFNQKIRVLYLLTMAKTSITINPKSVYSHFKFDTLDDFKQFLSELNIVSTNTGNIDCKKSLLILLESKYLKSKKIGQ